MSAHWTVYCVDCEQYGPDIRRSGGVTLEGLWPRHHPELGPVISSMEIDVKYVWASFLDKHEWHKLELHHE